MCIDSLPSFGLRAETVPGCDETGPCWQAWQDSKYILCVHLYIQQFGQTPCIPREGRRQSRVGSLLAALRNCKLVTLAWADRKKWRHHFVLCSFAGCVGESTGIGDLKTVIQGWRQPYKLDSFWNSGEEQSFLPMGRLSVIHTSQTCSRQWTEKSIKLYRN